jgi:hypothetical protein
MTVIIDGFYGFFVVIYCSRLGFPHAYVNDQFLNDNNLPNPPTHSSSSPSIRHSSTGVLVWYTVNTSLVTTDTILPGSTERGNAPPKQFWEAATVFGRRRIDHHRFGGRCRSFPRFWGCTRSVSVVNKSARDRPRVGTLPRIGSGRWQPDFGAGGFGHHRFGNRCLTFSRFWGCTRPVSVVTKPARDRCAEGTLPRVNLGRRTEDLGVDGFVHYRFGVRCLPFSRFWGCTRLSDYQML